MDVNTLRVIVTVLGLVLFVLLFVRTWSKSRQAEHAQAAMLPFQSDLDPEIGGNRTDGPRRPAQQGEKL